MALTREQILARKVSGNTESYKEDGEEIAVVRGLTLDEAMQLKTVDGEAAARGDKEYLMISFGMLEPRLSFSEVKEWASQDSAGTLTNIAQLINQLSRMGEGAGKSGVPRTRKRS